MNQSYSPDFKPSQASDDSQYFSQTYTIADDDDDDLWVNVDRLREDLVKKEFLHPSVRPYSRIMTEGKTFTPEYVKQVLTYYISQFSKGQSHPIGVINRSNWSNTEVDESRGLNYHNAGKFYTFLTKRRQGLMVTLMCRILEACHKKTKVTKRALYYKDKHSYGSQKVCDTLIEDVCCFTKIPRRSLFILNCGKGLVYGHLNLIVDGKKEDCRTFPSGYPLPYDIDCIDEIESSPAKFILIVEKDSSFQHLIKSKFFEKFPTILVTGKGFPDFTTRRFVKILAESLSIPLFAFVDCDPWGIEIVCVYKYGSLQGAHDSSKIPGLRWLGILPEDILSGHWEIPEQNISELSNNDKKKIEDLLKRNYILQNDTWREQIKLMKRKNKKSEIQQIDLFKEQFLVNEFFPYKLRHGKWI